MTDLLTPIPKNSEFPLAITLPLSGQHLIEASAGTGKTWTLTGIVLRLLIEEGYACDHIIASTFTRSASAEMRERIRGRLQDMEQLLRACQQALEQLRKALKNQGQSVEVLDENALNFDNFSSDLSPQLAKDSSQYQAIKQQQYAQFREFLRQWVEQKGLEAAFDDPINQYLIAWLAQHEFDLEPLQHSDVSLPVEKTAISDINETIAISPTLEPSADRPTNEKLTPKRPQKPIDFHIALVRTTTALNQLDRLFVGTLDSLCQKWLREFSADTGYQPTIQISNNVENIILAMIHDELRAFRATVDEHEPAVLQLMYASHRLPKADDFLPVVTKALNFYSTPIDIFIPEPFDLSYLENLLNDLSHIDTETLRPYAAAEFRLKQGMKSNAVLHTQFFEAFGILKQLNQQGLLGLLQLSKTQKNWLHKVANCVAIGEGFKTAFTTQKQQFIGVPLIQRYAQLYHASQAFEQHIDDLNQYFHRFICDCVRERLPAVLEAQQLTTFSLQLARLNDALDSKQGESLARYIRYQYPVALIDESQDINTEQALLIQRIYLPNNSLSNNKVLEKNKITIQQNKRQFLLLVGDPKQAIYGFRGGDVANYNQLKAQFPQKAEELTQNRRSSPAIINGLNHWFGKPSDTVTITHQGAKGEALPEQDQAYFLGDNIYYRPIQASRDKSDLIVKNLENDTGIYLLNLAYGQTVPTHTNKASNNLNNEIDATDNTTETSVDFNEVVAAQILALFDPNKKAEPAITYRDKNDEIRPLRLGDIGILADKNKQLDSLEQTLQRHNIATSRGGSQSLFAGEMTQDLIVLMQAMLYPYDITRLRRLLLSHFFALTLDQVEQNYAQCEQAERQITLHKFTPMADIQQMITEAGKLWQKSGFLTAIQWLLNQNVLLEGARFNFWQRLAQQKSEERQKSGERLLIDLRQLLDIMSQLSHGLRNDMGEYQLLEWLEQQHAEQPKEDWSMQQRLPSDDGVRLMTIHNSKGLEFPIVFVIGLDKKITTRAQPYQLYLYADNETKGLQNRHLSPVAYRKLNGEKQADYYKKIESVNVFQEKLRLAYVALTRCRDRLYIVVQSSKSNENEVPLKQWLSGKTFDLPEHLTDIVTQVDIASLSAYFDPNALYQTAQIVHETTDNTSASENYRRWQANIQLTQFIGWSNTSFTALARHLQHDKQAVAINQPDYLFEGQHEQSVAHQDVSEPIMVDDLPYQAVRFTFEKGSNAGTFLHKILENLPPIMPSDLAENGQISTQTFKQWRPIIDRAVKTYQISTAYLSDSILANDTVSTSPVNYPDSHNPNVHYANHANPINDAPRFDPDAGYFAVDYDPSYNDTVPFSQADTQATEPPISPKHQALAQWLYEIMQTPLLASNTTLAQLNPKQKIAELSFDMSLRQDFLLQDINALYKTVGITLNLNTQGQITTYWRYLRGEIDLIYQAGEQGSAQFFIVDYKSNYLGNQFASYDETAMMQAMDEHGYWIQAGIYQVALHRYLRLRLPNYDINQHLGAVEYVFLRGMSPDYPAYGRLVCRLLTASFIEKLDKILGNAGKDDKPIRL